jgi:CheY-like chemotaxis protein
MQAAPLREDESQRLAQWPARLGAATSPLPAPSDGATTSIQGMRVLVVDDNPMNRIVAERFLREGGLRPQSVESAHEALQALDSGEFDAVLMDLYMPEMNGDEAVRRIRARHGDALPIIAVSASVSADEERRCRDAGMNSFVPKPVDPVKLLEELARLLIYRAST